MEQLDFLYAGGETRRFHTVPVLREQSVAAHSWHVAMLVWTLFGQCEPGVRLPFIMAALTHDMAEHRVGDLPAPAKRNMEDRLELKGATTFRKAWGDMEQDILREVSYDFEGFLTVEELTALKFCDALDGAMYCVIERSMGNQTIAPCYLNFQNYFTTELETLRGSWPEEVIAIVTDAVQHVTTQWEIANGS